MNIKVEKGIKIYDSKKFIEMLQKARISIEEDLSNKYLLNDVRIFLGVLNELQSAAENAKKTIEGSNPEQIKQKCCSGKNFTEMLEITIQNIRDA